MTTRSSVACGATALLLGLTLVACGGSTPGGSSGSGSTVGGTASVVSRATATGEAIDACSLLTRAEVEREAGGTVKVDAPIVGEPNPRKETRCNYTSLKVELEVRTAVDRRDYDLERTAATAQGRQVADLTGLGDAAFSDRGQLITSVDVLARGRWLRIFGSFGRNQDLESLKTLAAAAVARLP